MNLALSDEQEFLREAARGALSRHKTVEAAREALEDPEALPDLWPVAVEAGWPGLLIDEDRGGAGLGVFDAMLVVACAAVLALRGAGLPSRCYAWLTMLVLLGAAAVWVYVFAGLSYALMRLGFVEYALPPRPDDLLAHLTDAYSWHFLDLLPGVGVNSALGWQCPVDLEGGRRGALLVLFRVAVLYQIFAKGRELLKRDERSGAPEANS